jgi:photosystem II stability/assembly factor-like uncharacterized protein
MRGGRVAKILSLAILIGLLFLAEPASSAAEDFVWRQVGFEGARIDSMAASTDGQTVYLATEVGLHVSEDAGETWYYAGQSLDRQDAPPVAVLAVHPRDGRVAFAGTLKGEGAGLYATWDTGRNWQRIFAGDGYDGVRAITLDGDDPEHFFLSVRPVDATSDDIVASVDGGKTWTIRFTDRGSHAHLIYSVQSDGHLSLYAPNQQGVLISRDGGHRWSIATNLRVPVFNLALHPRALAGRQPGPLYATSATTVYQSTDFGTTWRRMPSPQLSVCEMYGRESMVIGPFSNPVLYVSTSSLCPDDAVARVFALPVGDGALDQEWVDVTAGLPEVEVIRLALLRQTTPQLYAMTSSGLWVTELAARPPAFEEPAVSGEALPAGPERQDGLTSGPRPATERGAATPAPLSAQPERAQRGPLLWIGLALAALAGATTAVVWIRRKPA